MGSSPSNTLVTINVLDQTSSMVKRYRILADAGFAEVPTTVCHASAANTYCRLDDTWARPLPFAARSLTAHGGSWYAAADGGFRYAPDSGALTFLAPPSAFDRWAGFAASPASVFGIGHSGAQTALFVFPPDGGAPVQVTAQPSVLLRRDGGVDAGVVDRLGFAATEIFVAPSGAIWAVGAQHAAQLSGAGWRIAELDTTNAQPSFADRMACLVGESLLTVHRLGPTQVWSGAGAPQAIPGNDALSCAAGTAWRTRDLAEWSDAGWRPTGLQALGGITSVGAFGPWLFVELGSGSIARLAR